MPGGLRSNLSVRVETSILETESEAQSWELVCRVIQLGLVLEALPPSASSGLQFIPMGLRHLTEGSSSSVLREEGVRAA